MKQDVTIVCVQFKAEEMDLIEKKAWIVIENFEWFQMLQVETTEGHKTFSPIEMNLLERKAWLAIDDLGYRMTGNTATLIVYHATDDREIIELKMSPKQEQTITRR